MSCQNMRNATLLILTISCLSVNAQEKGKTTDTKNKWSRVPTYYVFGVAPVPYIDTKKLYGFKVKFKGCLVKDRHIRHNKKVEQIINARFGENWFEEHVENMQVRYEN